MQYPFSCMPATYDAIETTLAPARLARYLHASSNNKHLALRLYVWNARICEALYLPLQFAEVSSRNTISLPVRKRFGEDWFNNSKFHNILPARQKETLKTTVSKESKRREGRLNQDHVIAALPFGFWVSLMTKSYQNHLWINGLNASFPNAEQTDTWETIYCKLDQMRHFRNAVAHQYAIFDKTPQKEMQNALGLISLICGETSWLASKTSNLSRVINERPKS